MIEYTARQMLREAKIDGLLFKAEKLIDDLQEIVEKEKVEEEKKEPIYPKYPGIGVFQMKCEHNWCMVDHCGRCGITREAFDEIMKLKESELEKILHDVSLSAISDFGNKKDGWKQQIIDLAKKTVEEGYRLNPYVIDVDEAKQKLEKM